MNRSVVCYFQPGKRKARIVCEAFARGAGGQAVPAQGSLQQGPAAFYGVRPGWLQLWQQAKAESRDWFYIDNKYLGPRKQHFRVTKNALQSDGIGRPAWDRLARLGVEIKPWLPEGRHVLVCPQSDEFFQTFGVGDWLGRTLAELPRHTGREIRVRRKGDATPFEADLVDAFAVVTHSSNAAVDALLAGVPVVTTGWGPAQRMGRTDLSLIENPLRPDGREEWAAILAGQQWSREEMRCGACWRDLRG